MPTVVLIGFTNLFSMQMLIPQGKEKISLLASISGLLVDAVANYLLIPRYDIVGASLATLLAEAIVFLIEFISLKELLLGAFQKIKWLTLLYATIASLIGMNLIRYVVSGAPAFIVLCVCAIVFFGIYLLVLIALKEPLIYENYCKLVQKLKNRSF